MTVDVVGIPIQNVTLEQAVQDVSAFLDTKGKKVIVTPNAEILQLCVEDQNVHKIISKADYIIPDGIGVVKGAKLLGTPLKQKVAGCPRWSARVKNCFCSVLNPVWLPPLPRI